MKRLILIVAMMLSIATTSSAQNFTLTPNKSLKKPTIGLRLRRTDPNNPSKQLNDNFDAIDKLFPTDVSMTVEFATFEAAVTALCPSGDSSPVKTLIIPVVTAVASNTTVCKPLTLEFTGSGRLDPATGVVVTDNGPLIAPLRQVIQCVGSEVCITGLTEAQSVWFGFLPSATGTANATALSTATTAATSVDIMDGTYTVQGNANITTPTILTGYGATLNFTINAANQGIKITSSDVSVFGLTLNGPQFAAFNQTQNAILAQGTDNDPSAPTFINNIHIEDVKMTGWGSNAIEFLFVEYFNINHNRVLDCYKYGFLILSSRFGDIDHNKIKGVIADGVVGTNAYGITLTKNGGTEVRFPVSHHIGVDHNTLDDMRTWKALDTHGGRDLVFSNNIVTNARTGIGLVSFPDASGGAGNGRAPIRVTVIGNTISRGTLVSVSDVQAGISMSGEGTATLDIRSTGGIIVANTIDGYGSDSISGKGAIQIQYTGNTVVIGNPISNSGRQAIMIFSSQNMNVSNNSIKTISGAASVAPVGTITFGGNPSDADTITINNAVWTYKTTPAATRDILIGGNLSDTLDTTSTDLEASVDGRVSTATYTNSATVLTVTSDTIGRSLNTFTLAASVAAAVNLTGGAIGSSGLDIQKLSGPSGALAESSGIIADNTFDIGAFTGIQFEDDNIKVRLHNNIHLGTGPLYDMKGSGARPQSGSGNIVGLFSGVFTSDIPSIAAGASASIFAPAPGVPAAGASATVSLNRFGANFDGLSVAIGALSDNFLEIRFLNTSSGALNLESTSFAVTADKVSGSTAIE